MFGLFANAVWMELVAHPIEPFNLHLWSFLVPFHVLTLVLHSFTPVGCGVVALVCLPLKLREEGETEVQSKREEEGGLLPPAIHAFLLAACYGLLPDLELSSFRLPEVWPYCNESIWEILYKVLSINCTDLNKDLSEESAMCSCFLLLLGNMLQMWLILDSNLEVFFHVCTRMLPWYRNSVSFMIGRVPSSLTYSLAPLLSRLLVSTISRILQQRGGARGSTVITAADDDAAE